MANIQHYFSALRLTHVRGYLLKQGWEVSEASPPSQVLFLGPMHDQGARYELYFPTQDGNAQFRDRVMRSIFNLSCIEDREPIEIAMDMAAARDDAIEPAETKPTPASGPEVLQFENSSPEKLVIQIAQTAAELVLHQGDAIELTIERNHSGRTRVTHGPQRLILDAGEATSLRVYQTRLGKPLPASHTVSELVRQVMAAGADEAESLEATLNELQGTFSRADFALAAPTAGRAPPQTTRQQTALILAALASRLTSQAGLDSAAGLWRIACQLLNRGKIAVRLIDGGAQELHSVAQSDEELAPHQTMTWLTSYTRHADD